MAKGSKISSVGCSSTAKPVAMRLDTISSCNWIGEANESRESRKAREGRKMERFRDVQIRVRGAIEGEQEQEKPLRIARPEETLPSENNKKQDHLTRYSHRETRTRTVVGNIPAAQDDTQRSKVTEASCGSGALASNEIVGNFERKFLFRYLSDNTTHTQHRHTHRLVTDNEIVSIHKRHTGIYTHTHRHRLLSTRVSWLYNNDAATWEEESR